MNYIYSEEFIKLIAVGIFIPMAIVAVIGFIFAILQALTQIQDQIIGFFPKLIAISLLLVIGLNSYLSLIVELMRTSLNSIRDLQ